MSLANDFEPQHSPLMRALLRFRKHLVYRFATQVVPNSVASARDVQRVFRVRESKCCVFHNTLRDPLQDGHILNQRIIGPAERLHQILCVGRLHPCKGQDVLIRALSVLKDTLPNVSVEFVGDGPCKRSYMRLAQEMAVDNNCNFLGTMPHEEVLLKMATSTVTVVPSRSEAFGLVALESLAVGTPVVASAVDGIVEIFNDGQEGFLVPPDEPLMLADRLKTTLLNNNLRRTMASKARKRFLQFEQRRGIVEQADWFEAITTFVKQGSQCRMKD